MAYAFTSAGKNKRGCSNARELKCRRCKDSAFSTALGTLLGAIVNGIFT